jgi:hypothetical protein
MPIPVSLIEALRLGTPLAVEVPASDPERLAGVSILPKREPMDRQAQTEGWKASVLDRTFFVYWREYSRRHMENNWDIAPGDGMWELKRAKVVGEQALEQLLQEWGIPLEALTYLWKTNIPE